MERPVFLLTNHELDIQSKTKAWVLDHGIETDKHIKIDGMRLMSQEEVAIAVGLFYNENYS